MSAFDESTGESQLANRGPVSCMHTLDRRAFLERAALGVLAALVAGGLAPTVAMAEHVGEVTPLRSAGNARTYAIPAQDGVFIDTANDLALVRSNGRIYAFSISCPHRGAALQWNAGERRFYCPKHKARFTPDGAHASGRATADLDRYALQRSGAQVIVALDQPLEAKSAPAAWAAAVVVI